MNKENAKDYLPLLQAFADGKTLQKRISGFLEYRWEDVLDPIFSDPPHYYRIKPEPLGNNIETADHLEELARNIRSGIVTVHGLSEDVSQRNNKYFSVMKFLYSCKKKINLSIAMHKDCSGHWFVLTNGNDEDRAHQEKNESFVKWLDHLEYDLPE